MTRSLKAFAALGSLALVAGCATGWNLDALQSAERVGSPFTVALANGYQELADYEGNTMQDWVDADYFAQKGLAAAAGEAVPPEDLGNWVLPEESIPELSDARNQLVTALGQFADSKPETAALCQIYFDCWVEQQEENHQPTHIGACREAFFDCLAELGAVPTATGTFVILFDFDRADLTAAGQQVVSEIVATGLADPAVSFDIVGHADTSGAGTYNQRLSERRAATVQQALIAGGIQPGRITAVTGAGETQPAVPTGDGVRNQANRRVVVSLL